MQDLIKKNQQFITKIQKREKFISKLFFYFQSSPSSPINGFREIQKNIKTF